MHRHVPIVMSTAGGALPTLGRARIESVYPQRVAGFAPALVDNLRVLRRLLVGGHADLWHFFFAPNPKTSRAARIASRLRGKKTLQTVCSAPAAHVDLHDVLFADRIVVLSQHTQRRFLDAGIDAARVSLIRPSIPALDPVSDAARAALRQGLGLPAQAPIVVYAGDLEFGCGADLALGAHAALPKTLGAQLVMACRAKTERAKQRDQALRAHAERLGVAASVHWLGETPRIHDVLAAADVVTMPTDTLYAKMDMPLVLVEAMSLARAVLVGDGTPASELAMDDAAICVPTDATAVTEATVRLLDDAQRRQQLGERARATVLRDYDPARMAATYERLYDALMT